MGRTKGEAHPPGTGDKISKSLKAYYKLSQRKPEHNKAIGQGVADTAAKKKAETEPKKTAGKKAKGK